MDVKFEFDNVRTFLTDSKLKWRVVTLSRGSVCICDVLCFTDNSRRRNGSDHEERGDRKAGWNHVASCNHLTPLQYDSIQLTDTPWMTSPSDNVPIIHWLLHCVSKKVQPLYFCAYVVRCLPILIIFSRIAAEKICNFFPILSSLCMKGRLTFMWRPCPINVSLSYPPLDNIRVMVIVWRLRGNHVTHWDPYAMHRCGCLESYYCNMVEWFCWDSSLIWK